MTKNIVIKVLIVICLIFCAFLVIDGNRCQTSVRFSNVKVIHDTIIEKLPPVVKVEKIVVVDTVFITDTVVMFVDNPKIVYFNQPLRISTKEKKDMDIELNIGAKSRNGSFRPAFGVTVKYHF